MKKEEGKGGIEREEKWKCLLRVKNVDKGNEKQGKEDTRVREIKVGERG